MKIIGKGTTNTFIVEATAHEIDRLAGVKIGYDPGGYQKHDRDILVGTEFHIIKAFDQIYRNEQRKQEIEIVRKTLEGVINTLDIIAPFIEEPKPESETA